MILVDHEALLEQPYCVFVVLLFLTYDTQIEVCIHVKTLGDFYCLLIAFTGLFEISLLLVDSAKAHQGIDAFRLLIKGPDQVILSLVQVRVFALSHEDLTQLCQVLSRVCPILKPVSHRLKASLYLASPEKRPAKLELDIIVFRIFIQNFCVSHCRLIILTLPVLAFTDLHEEQHIFWILVRCFKVRSQGLIKVFMFILTQRNITLELLNFRLFKSL